MDFPSWGTFHPQSISDENNLQVQLRGASKWNWGKAQLLQIAGVR
jgi:hypothetical protein